MRNPIVPASVAALALSASLTAQILPVDLTYNFNGIVHAGEQGLPDAPNGFRSISDRALDFTAGVPTDPQVANYVLESQANVLDMVHLGNRNTVDNGNWAFVATYPGANMNVGTQPAWLPNVDQKSTPQVSVLTIPMPIGTTTYAKFLCQGSNGGGSFDIIFTMASMQTYTATVSVPDWYSGQPYVPNVGLYLGTGQVDMGNPDATLVITEVTVDLSAYAGDVVTEIAFANPTNPVAGFGIYAANFEYPPPPRTPLQIPLAYNFNGIVHTGEAALPDDPIGFRSISDRALDFSAGVPSDALLDKYHLVDQPGQLDLVHLGDRNTVAGASMPWDLVVDGDDIGIQPAWLPVSDQTGPQSTQLANPVLLDAASEATVLFQVSNGGGTMDVEFTFQSGNPVVATVFGGDWWGGAYLGTNRIDYGNPEHNLNVVEATIDLSAQAGRIVTAVAFQNRSNFNAGYAILAMNMTGCLYCNNAAVGAVNNLGGGVGPTMSTTTNGNLGCDLDWTVAGGTPGGFGFFAAGLGTTTLPLSTYIPPCAGTIHVNPLGYALASLDATGSATFRIPQPVGQNLCGVTFTLQYVEPAVGACYVTIGDALAITIGN